MAGPKITVIGAGSFFFGRPVVHKMATSPVMAGGTLALVDTREHVVKTMAQLARRMFKATGCGVKVEASTDRRKVLPGSDFVVFTFSERNAHYRGLDTQIAAKHGIRMCSSDTIGPGGIFRALREVPRALEMARDVKRLCPNAWVVSFVNPTTVLGMALRRYAPDVKSFALCDGHHEPYHTLKRLKQVDLLPEDATEVSPEMAAKLDLAVGGVNHFTWTLRFNYDGKDMMPTLKRKLREDAKRENANAKDRTGSHSKGRFNAAYGLQLFDIFGVYPDTMGHTKEYVPYFQGHGVKPVKPEPIWLFDAENRARQMEARFNETRKYATGKLPAKKFIKEVGDDHATDIIESMWGGLGKPFYINTANNGAVTNMPDEAFLEARCDVDMKGPRPQPIGEMPRGVLGLQHQVLDTHELTAEAAVTGDRAILRRAMLTDPLCVNIPDADACIADLLKAESDILPGYWYKRQKK